MAESKGYISLAYFTHASFRRPPRTMLSFFRQIKRSDRLAISNVALLLILEKNLTGAVSLERASNMLKAAQAVPHQELSSQEIIDRVLRLLARRGPVSRDEAWTLEGEITGSWT